jgi:O-antigen/teichoic acid export membrane protein
MDDARATVRNAALMIGQRGVQMVGGFLFFALVPRVMGPSVYGRFALITSLALWFALGSGLGFAGATARYIPQFLARGDREGVRRLIGNLLTLRLGSGAAAAAVYLVVAIVLWDDLDRGVLAIVAASVLVQGVSSFLFANFLGFNKAGHAAVGDALRRWLLLLLVLPGFHWGGLKGAAVAVLATDLVVAALGLWWSRPLPTKVHLWPDFPFLARFLRFGMAYLGTQWFYIAFEGSGEPLVRAFAGSYAQVSYFGLAQSVYLAAASMPSQLMLAFAPLLSGLRDRGQTEALTQWISRLLKCLAAGAVLLVFGMVFMSDLFVALVFGDRYTAVAPNLVILSFAVLMLTLGSVSSVRALVQERPGLPFEAGVLRLAVFWSAGPPLVARWESLGACVAVVAAASAHALYLTWRIRDAPGSRQLTAWLIPIGLGAIFLPLASFRSSSVWSIAAYLLFVAAYLSTLFGLRVLTMPELRSLVSLVGLRREAGARTP